jgi:polyhydroxyalkanoate synthase
METASSQARPAPDLLSQLLAEQQRAWRRLLSIPRVVEAASATRVGTTPQDVVLEERTFRLLRYRRETPATYAQPLLLCYALINRAYILDLQPDKSVAARYLAQGFDVYLIDWGVPTAADHVLRLEDYVCQFLKRAVEHILGAHRRDDLHLLGYCMGGTMATLLAALHPELVSSLTLLAAPIDFEGRESLLQIWADRRHFDVDAFVDAHGNCPAWFLQSCFLYMKPIQNLLEKNIAFYEQMDDPRAVSSYFAMERWINDNIPVAGETFREFVKKLYQGNELVRGQLHLGGRRADLGRIRCPLLLLTARNDNLVAPSSTEGIRPHVGSRDIESMMIDAGHVGLIVGGRAQKTIWPQATRWLADRSTAVSSAAPGSSPAHNDRPNPGTE